MLVPALITLLAAVQPYPHVAPAGPDDRVLIIAPHIDDEAVGAGGYAHDAIANGADVFVAFLTAGDSSRFAARVMGKAFGPTQSNYLSVGRRRIAEARDAMRVLNVPPERFFFLGYPDRGLRAILENPASVVESRGTRRNCVPYAEAMSPGKPYSLEHLLADIEQVIAIAQPTIVIAPVSFDSHSDHSAAAEIIEMALEDIQPEPRRLGYLVHASRLRKPLFWMPRRAVVPPARLRKFTWATYPLTREVRRVKDAVLRAYKSQRPYVYLLRNAYVRRNELFLVYDEPEITLQASD